MAGITIADPAKLAEELVAEITTNGLYGRSKTDFYDYVLYLLDRHDSGHFLSRSGNAENERLLKVSATRIKAAKKNISVKFMSNEEYDRIFLDFLARIASGALPSLSDRDDSYTMVIEDIALRSILEAKLKRTANTTLDYHLNTELVTISHGAFVAMLSAEMRCGTQELLSDVLKRLAKDRTATEIRRAIQEVLDSDSFQSLGINALKALTHFAADKLSAAR